MLAIIAGGVVLGVALGFFISRSVPRPLSSAVEAANRLASFDMIFLRNVMIYFNGDTKRQVIARIVSVLKPGGHLCIGHSESLNDISIALVQLAPSIYRKPF